MAIRRPWLEAAGVQERLGISSATFYRWLRDGRLKGTKVGGRWRFSRSMVEALLRAPEADDEQISEVFERVRVALARRLVSLGLDESELNEMSETETEAESIARMIVAHGVARKASDVHLFPGAGGVAIRERVDGVLADAGPSLPQATSEEVLEAIKKLAGMDPHVVDRPQESRCFFEAPGRKVEVRASTYPTALGDSVTLRLLDPESARLQLREIGFSEPLHTGILKAIHRPHGVFLVNGPTGMGKSTTLYSALLNVARPGLKVMTIEDPVELYLDGVLQAAVTEGMDFLDAMRAMLRADLDVGLVGELRDAETIRFLFQMAATGHLMMSSLHAPDAVSALGRLLEIGGVEPRILIENLRGILDQRLARKSCTGCRTLRKLTTEDKKQLRLPASLRRGKFASNEGCDRCNQTGVLGRTPVGEFLELTPAVIEELKAGVTSADDLRAALGPDHRTLEDDLFEKLADGVLAPEEVIRLQER